MRAKGNRSKLVGDRKPARAITQNLLAIANQPGQSLKLVGDRNQPKQLLRDCV
ncbi:MAG TPA: hypothetical protein V6D16_22730 [Candidatus Obscuribacterales bacterium]